MGATWADFATAGSDEDPAAPQCSLSLCCLTGLRGPGLQSCCCEMKLKANFIFLSQLLAGQLLLCFATPLSR